MIELRVREIRKSRGLRQNELAKLAGISKSYLSEFERGMKTVNTGQLDKLARALGCEIRDFFGSGDPDRMSFIRALESLSPSHRRLVYEMTKTLVENTHTQSGRQ